MKKLAILLLPVLLLEGCFTLKKTEMQPAVLTRAPEGRDVSVSLTGFAATITEYLPIYGYQTVYVDDGWHGRRGRRGGWWGGHYETATTSTFVPRTHASAAFLKRAEMRLEDAGFVLRAPKPSYTADVTFEGPFVTDGELGVEFAWQFCSILSAEYTTQTWTARLRIHDTKTGRVVHSRDFSSKYEHCVWSPLFFIGLAGCTENTVNYIQNWCLADLTDRATADISAFLSAP